MSQGKALTPVGDLLPMEVDEFRLFQGLISREAGIFLSEEKRDLVVARLGRRLRDLGLRSFGAYYRIVKRDPEEQTHMLDCICTNETHFFREGRQFDLLEEIILPAWEIEASCGGRPRCTRAWSAGCSTGEEPFSLAMALLGSLPGWQVEILATDLSTRALDLARSAVWPIDKARAIPERHLKRFMLKGSGAQEVNMKAGPELTSVIRFQRVNLNADPYPIAGIFDLIFCRNVLIYFSPESRQKALTRLLCYLAQDGFLFLGHSEGLNSHPELSTVMPTVYTRKRK